MWYFISVHHTMKKSSRHLILIWKLKVKNVYSQFGIMMKFLENTFSFRKRGKAAIPAETSQT